jgi:hypothetical protein
LCIIELFGNEWLIITKMTAIALRLSYSLMYFIEDSINDFEAQ